MAPSSKPILLIMVLCLLSSSSSSQLSSAQMSAANTISAAPALLPTTTTTPPIASPPALSPDITPLFPSPGKSDLSPTESSLPTIPSSPSPPNPDDIPSFGPNTMAIPPDGSLPESSSVSRNSAIGATVMAVFSGAFLSFHIMI